MVGTGKVCLVGGIEQTNEELYPEDVAHTVVNDFFAQSAFLHQFAEGKDEGVGRAEGTAYVQPGFHALADGFFHVFGGAVLGVEVFYGVTVGYDVATESHFATQAGGEPVVAALHGDTVVIVVRTHYAQHAGFPDDAFERVDVYVLHFARRHLRVHACHAFAGAFVVTVSGKVLAGGGHLVVVLQAAHHFDAQFGYEVGRFAVNFFVASPALVASYVEDGGVDVGVAQHAGFASGDESYLANQFTVPGMSQSQLGGEVGGAVAFHAAYAFVGKVYGDAETGIFHKEPLHLVQCPGVARGGPDVGIVRGRQPPLLEAVQVFVDGADAVFPEQLFPFGGGEVVFQYAFVAVEGDHLAGLFVQRHLLQQVFDACFERGGGVFVHVFHSVFVEVYPTFAVHFTFHRLVGCRCFGRLLCAKQCASSKQQG